MPITQWLLQVTVEVPGTLGDEDLGRLLDAIRQRLVALAERLAMRRLGALKEWGIPVDDDGNITGSLSAYVPHFVRTSFLSEQKEHFQAPLYEMFVAEWVFKPLLDKVRSDLDQLLSDLNLWKQGSASDGNFSLDEIYLSINRLIDSLESVDTAVNMFIRRNSKEDKKNTKKRSAVVRLWKACRKVISDGLVR
jgi:hypothetical protein